MPPKSPARKPLISGNWKMNHNHFEAIQSVQKLSYLLHKDDFEGFMDAHPDLKEAVRVAAKRRLEEITGG